MIVIANSLSVRIDVHAYCRPTRVCERARLLARALVHLDNVCMEHLTRVTFVPCQIIGNCRPVRLHPQELITSVSCITILRLRQVCRHSRRELWPAVCGLRVRAHPLHAAVGSRTIFEINQGFIASRHSVKHRAHLLE